MLVAGSGRDAWIVEGLRTPMGRAHPERNAWLQAGYPFVEIGLVTMRCGGGLGTVTLVRRCE